MVSTFAQKKESASLQIVSSTRRNGGGKELGVTALQEKREAKEACENLSRLNKIGAAALAHVSAIAGASQG